MKKNRFKSYVKSFDKYIFSSYLLLGIIGLIVMVDISSVQSSMVYFYRQAVFFVISLLSVLFILYYFNLEKLRRLNIYLVYVSILMLIMVLVKGTTVKGATRGISLGFINIQPSFFARIALVFFFAGVLDKKNELLIKTKKLFDFPKHFLELTILGALVFLLIYLEKHLSSILIGGATLLGMLFYAGIRKRILMIILMVGVLGAGLVVFKGDGFRAQRMRTYKKYSLFFKERDLTRSEGSDYQVKESLTALTSGGIFGTGLSRGRGKHYYLPEARTDYVFTIIGEETGYIGAMVVFLLHSLLFFAALKMANAQENRYYRFLGVGMALNIYVNVLVNTGVAMSILPPTGNTLPFISYGGSALLMDGVAIGVLLNISAERRTL